MCRNGGSKQRPQIGLFRSYKRGSPNGGAGARVDFADSRFSLLFPAIIAAAASRTNAHRQRRRRPGSSRRSRPASRYACAITVLCASITMHGCATRTGARSCRTRRGSRRPSAPISTAENRYADAVQAPLAGLRAKLVAEMKGRIQPQDIRRADARRSVCVLAKIRPRRRASSSTSARRATAGDEEVLVDGNALAKGKPYFAFGDYRIHSPDHRLLCLHVRRQRLRELHPGGARSRRPSAICPMSSRRCRASPGPTATSSTMSGMTTSCGRASSTGTASGPIPPTIRWSTRKRICSFSVSVGRTGSGRFVVISAATSDTSEVRIVETARPESEPRLIQARDAGTDVRRRRRRRPADHPAPTPTAPRTTRS